MTTDNNIQEQIKQTIANNKVVLYLKGTKDAPMCGFSAKVLKILKMCNIDNFLAINVLADNEVRQGIKEYAAWPTIPQLYINGEFIGGSDIVTEMYDSGELQELFK